MSRTSPVRMAVWLAALSVAALMLAVARVRRRAPRQLVWTVSPPHGTNYFALCVAPNVAVPAAPAHDVVVLFDTSATQIDEYRTRGLAALSTLFAGLTPTDRVQLLAVDVNAIPMTPGFVAAGSAEMSAAVAKLQRRVPLGASDMDKALSAAAAAFSGAPVNPRAAVYIGKGTSLANLLATARFDQLVGTLTDNRIAVSSLAIGPRLDMPLLGALAGRTGGRVIRDALPGPSGCPGQADPLDAASPARNWAPSCCAVQGPVLWPQSVTYPPAFTEVFPKRTPPLRLDRDSVVVGCYQGAGPFDVQMTVAGPNGPQTLSWKVTPGPSRPANAYLGQLVQLARIDGGASLPLVELGEPGGGRHDGGHLRAQRARNWPGRRWPRAISMRRRSWPPPRWSRSPRTARPRTSWRRSAPRAGPRAAWRQLRRISSWSPRGTPWAAAGRRLRRPVPISPTARAPSPKASNIKTACSPR